jgi:hypothetical protein
MNVERQHDFIVTESLLRGVESLLSHAMWAVCHSNTIGHKSLVYIASKQEIWFVVAFCIMIPCCNLVGEFHKSRRSSQYVSEMISEPTDL